MPGDTTIIPVSESAGFTDYYISRNGDTIWLQPPPPVEGYQQSHSYNKGSGESKPMDSADLAIIIGIFIIMFALAGRKKRMRMCLIQNVRPKPGENRRWIKQSKTELFMTNG